MDERWVDQQVEDLAKAVRNRLVFATKNKEKLEESVKEAERLERMIWVGHIQALEALEPYVDALEREWKALKGELR